MGNKVMKTFTVLEVYNIIQYLNNLQENQVKELPTKMRWYLKKNMDKLTPIAKSFEEFRDGLVKELHDNYFNDEKSYEYAEVKRDEDGNPILKDDGTEETTQMRKVKDEYFDEYNMAISELNAKLNEILREQNDIEIATVDLDEFVESLPDDSPLDFDSLAVLCFMDETSNLKEG